MKEASLYWKLIDLEVDVETRDRSLESHRDLIAWTLQLKEQVLLQKSNTCVVEQ